MRSARPAGSNIDSSGRIDVSFLREAGLEEAFKKSRAEAEKLLGKVAERPEPRVKRASIGLPQQESVDAHRTDCGDRTVAGRGRAGALLVSPHADAAKAPRQGRRRRSGRATPSSKSLPPDLRKTASFPLDSPERTRLALRAARSASASRCSSSTTRRASC